MTTLDQYLSDQAIIDMLIRIRLSSARKRHDVHCLANLSTAAPDPLDKVPPLADTLLPPRRAWRRPPKARRDGFPKEDVNRAAIRRTVVGYLRAGKLAETEWGQRLLDFIQQVRVAASNTEFQFHTPRILLSAKENAERTYRPIAIYDDLTDQVILALIARYLRDCLDPDIPDNVYSFRKSGRRNHHAAIRDLQDYRGAFGTNGLYVSECDIRAFYDCVPHDVVRASIARAIELAVPRHITVDARACRLVEKYLASYSFFRVALPAAESILSELANGGKVDHLSRRELADLGDSPDSAERGIPQGGALSPLLANLVLSEVDGAVLATVGEPTLFYARFCDDIILAHPDRQPCAAALGRCLEATAGLRIPAHKPMTVIRYGREYYGIKSKAPYLWAGGSGRKRTVPWVSFLGYQLRYDGKLRVRAKSIRKEHMKQIRRVGEVVRLLSDTDQRLHVSGDEILNRTRERLIAMAIGRKNLRVSTVSSPQPCWADAFHLIDANVHSGAQLRALDRNRERQLNRLKRMLRRLGLLPLGRAKKKSPSSPFYWGAPYSYFGYFARSQQAPVRFTQSSIEDYKR